MTGCHPDAKDLHLTVTPAPEPKLLQDLRKMADDLDNQKKDIRYIQLNLQDACRQIEKLEDQLRVIRQTISEIDSKNVFQENKKPYRCPLCEGHGNYHQIFDGQSVATLMKCKICKETGVIWG